ncbi:MAG: hypothetical protein QOF27_33 [Gaiellaceae bacterium]|nr:hypothetical protein [Gaiellaceae bacterium]
MVANFVEIDSTILLQHRSLLGQARLARRGTPLLVRRVWRSNQTNRVVRESFV